MNIADEQYVSLVSFKANGSPKPTPIWIVDLGRDAEGHQQAGFTTWGQSWKVKRIRNNRSVTLQPCDQRGVVAEGSDVIAATARIGSTAEFDEVRQLVKAKYGVWVTVIKTMNTVGSLLGKGGQSDSAVIFTITAES